MYPPVIVLTGEIHCQDPYTKIQIVCSYVHVCMYVSSLLGDYVSASIVLTGRLALRLLAVILARMAVMLHHHFHNVHSNSNTGHFSFQQILSRITLSHYNNFLQLQCVLQQFYEWAMIIPNDQMK